MLWNSLNSTVFTAQVSSQKQIGLLRIVIAFMVINCSILILLFLMIRRILKKEIEYSANHNALTGLLNRSSFTILLSKAIARAERRKTVLAMLMMDIDHFKTVNDTYGHAAGDRVLSRFASRIEMNVRKEDVFARTGGEEFALLVSVDDPRSAQKIAENVLSIVSETDFSPVPNQTVSIGISLYGPGENVDAFLNRADTALYRSKADGRNRYTLQE